MKFSWFSGKTSAEQASPEPAVTQGLHWDLTGPDTNNPEKGDAVLHYDGKTLASVQAWQASGQDSHFEVETYVSQKDRGSLAERYSTLAEGMQATETWAFDRGIKLHLEDRDVERNLQLDPFAFFQKPAARQWSDASESYHARFFDRGGSDPSQDAETGRRDFGLDH